VAKDGDAVVIGMGEVGVPTRLLATRFGSRWTYGGKGVAPGQIPASRMLREFRFRGIGDQTLLYGAIDRSVTQVLSPVMHNAAFGAAGLDAVCVPLGAADFEDFLTFADALGIAGAGVGTPFEHEALTASVRADAVARSMGDANTLRRVADGWEATHIAAIGEDPSAPAASRQDDMSRLVAQAERQWEWWTGRRPQPGVMRAAALAETGHRGTEAQSRA
jgi:3-dehydroquinate dehydratase/shikimate dehydrogenase